MTLHTHSQWVSMRRREEDLLWAFRLAVAFTALTVIINILVVLGRG